METKLRDVTSKHYKGMGHIYKWLGTDEQAKELWQNREALDKYLARLKELMEEDRECGRAVSKEQEAGNCSTGNNCIEKPQD